MGYLHIVSKLSNMCLKKVIIYYYRLTDTELVLVIARFVVIVGINTISDISKLLYIISRAIRRVKFGPILKYHEWYLQYAKYHVQIILLFVYTTKWEIQSWNTTCIASFLRRRENWFQSSCFRPSWSWHWAISILVFF